MNPLALAASAVLLATLASAAHAERRPVPITPAMAQAIAAGGVDPDTLHNWHAEQISAGAVLFWRAIPDAGTRVQGAWVGARWIPAGAEAFWSTVSQAALTAAGWRTASVPRRRQLALQWTIDSLGPRSTVLTGPRPKEMADGPPLLANRIDEADGVITIALWLKRIQVSIRGTRTIYPSAPSVFRYLPDASRTESQ